MTNEQLCCQKIMERDSLEKAIDAAREKLELLLLSPLLYSLTGSGIDAAQAPSIKPKQKRFVGQRLSRSAARYILAL